MPDLGQIHIFTWRDLKSIVFSKFDSGIFSLSWKLPLYKNVMAFDMVLNCLCSVFIEFCDNKYLRDLP